MKMNRMDRAGRKLEVYKLLYEMNRSMTMYQIAQHFGLSPSSHFMSILKEMCEDGDLAKWETQHRPNSVKFYFYVRALAQPIEQLSLEL